MNIARRLHVGEDVILQLRNRLQGVWHVLVLLDIAYHFSSFCSLCKVDEVCAFDERGDTVFDKCQIRKIDT